MAAVNVERFRLRLPASRADVATQAGGPPRRMTEPFLKGPIPLTWLRAAATSPGASPLAVGLLLWHLQALTKSDEVVLSATARAKLGVERKAAYRGLSALEERGLVHVIRKRGQAPRVRIVLAPEGTSAR